MPPAAPITATFIVNLLESNLLYVCRVIRCIRPSNAIVITI
ncbi:Uncharacterised protein [Vibrio cholerae]|nr:Uncharacterised protein [Vibrio cholerae]